MKSHLLFENADVELGLAYTPRTGFTVEMPELPAHCEALSQDLELVTLLHAMADNDPLVYAVARQTLLTSLTNASDIAYRQEIAADALAHGEIMREIYAIAIEAIVRERKVYQPFGGHPYHVLQRAVEVLAVFVELLKRLRALADEHVETMHSRGMKTLFTMLGTELDDEYFSTIDDHLERLKFKGGSLMSAELGRGNRGVRYVLRAPFNEKRTWKERIGFDPPNSYSFQIAPRDEAGARFLSELADRGQNLAANALTQSTDHILSFFKLLCAEVSFYIGCLNLADHLKEREQPIVMPEVVTGDRLSLAYRGIYDICLTLRSGRPMVPNDADAGDKSLVMITGANSGGKSTLLRAIGLAQLMTQAGMFVGAQSFRANTVAALFTHFIREEDDTMESGKFDEELARMSEIADHISEGSLIMFNESFAATNEREGSEIGRQVVTALLEAGIKVIFVTHQFTLANAFFQQEHDWALFLRAERGDEGQRSYKLVEGPPLPTSFGEDLFERLGGWATRHGSPEGADEGRVATNAASPAQHAEAS